MEFFINRSGFKESSSETNKRHDGIDFILFKRNTWVCPNFIDSEREKNPDGFDTNPYSYKKECSNNVTGFDKQNKVILWREI